MNWQKIITFPYYVPIIIQLVSSAPFATLVVLPLMLELLYYLNSLLDRLVEISCTNTWRLKYSFALIVRTPLLFELLSRSISGNHLYQHLEIKIPVKWSFNDVGPLVKHRNEKKHGELVELYQLA